MSIDRIRYFAVVVETRSLRKAADLVGISPPSMSKAVSVLEHELGQKLVHQEGRGIGITPKGLEIYHASLPLLEEYRRFHACSLERQQGSAGLRMATFEVFSSYFISAFLKSEPSLELLLLEKPPGEIERAIVAGSVEIGLTYLPSPDSGLEFLEVGSFEMGVFGLKKWEGVPFERWPFAVPITDLRVHTLEFDSLDMWPRSFPKRSIKYRFELLETALQTTREGLSVLYCPSFIPSLQNVQVKNSMQLIALHSPALHKKIKPTKVYLVGKKGSVPVSFERKLAKFMRSLN